MRVTHTVRPVFDEANLVSFAGLIPALKLAESAGLSGLLGQLTVPSANAATKAVCVVAGMLAGADSIDDLDLLRHGGMGRVFTGIKAPSTLGTFLRSFTHGHVQQLDAAGAALLSGLAARAPGLIDRGETGQLTFVDVDDTVRGVHGYAKQAAAFGYSGIRGLNIQLATITGEQSAPVIARARLRRGNIASATGSGRLLAQAVGTARAAGVSGQILARADSAYYCHAFIGTALRHQAWFSVTARMDPKVKAAIAAIDEATWQTIRYPQAVFDQTEQRWISDAEVAEVPFVAFTSRRKAEHVPCRLVVRRVRRHQKLASDGSEQGKQFATWRHHAFVTNSTLSAVDADKAHRQHAIIEQVIAELKDGPLAHLPSGKYAANAAWVALAAIAFNLARATGAAAELGSARWAGLRRKVITIPARIAASGRRLILHLPRNWAYENGWHQLWATANAPPTPVAA